ncbi:pentatricopeptide repeat-containing protein [Striga asiatica]|uniref:Pentatricopeptide repeat-containing protein n=1 Tax=Striga asiatica TaxID=4170 RepID=A0A5A7PJQ1_STRAF|nr:pentatricopeptide repeat-containing protein [Striga asiatica]
MRGSYFKEITVPLLENPTQQLIELNRLLKTLVRTAQFSDALRLLRQIHSSGHLKPDHYTLSTAISACANSHDTKTGAQLHAHAIRSGLNLYPHVSNSLLSLYAKSHDLTSVKRFFREIQIPDAYSYTTLLSACVKSGELEDACRVFDQMPQRSVAVWNAMITGCAENGDETTAFGFFMKMLALGVRGDRYTFASVLSLCTMGLLDFGRQVHSLVVKTGFLGIVSVVNSLITMYFNCRSDFDACEVFNEVGREFGDEITYNAVIAGLVSMEMDEEALLAFKEMIAACLKPTELTFVSVMGVCFSSEIAGQVYGQAIKMKLGESTSVNNAAITMYSKCGDANTAYLVFLRLVEKDSVSWNAIITSYAEQNLSKDAIFAFKMMQRSGIEPDEFTIGSLLSTSNSLQIVEMIQATVIKNALTEKIEVSNALVSAFSRNGAIKQASRLFHGMQSRNLISWNSMISGFVLNNLPVNGLHLFSKLPYFGLRPNHYTLALALSICASMSDLNHGKELHSYILKFGYFLHTLLNNALIALYSSCGALEWALRVFKSMTEKDTVTWNSIISACADHGEGKRAIHWFETMLYQGVATPDCATFTAILSACSRSGLVSDAIRIFNLMVDVYGIEPKADHISCIFDLLGRGGFLELVERVVKERGVDFDPSMWWTLFTACVNHEHLELANIIAGIILQGGNKDPGVYVMLSNLYANVGKWEESANLRVLMKKYGVVKQPGSSQITT